MINNLSYTQEFILNRLRNGETKFYGHEQELQTVHDLLNKTVEFGESNSALIIGPPRSGKSTVSKNIQKWKISIKKKHLKILSSYHLRSSRFSVRNRSLKVP